MIEAVVLGSVIKPGSARCFLMLMVYLILTVMGTPLWKRPAMKESVVSVFLINILLTTGNYILNLNHLFPYNIVNK